MNLKIDEGKKGEEIAESFLRKKGYKIIERNFRIKGGEIDIIASKDNVLVFVEVKTRKSAEFGSPLEAITYWKLKSLIKTAQYFKLSHPNLPEQLRIDAVSVELSDGKEIKIEHIENISGF
ncbi:YraN family protein [Candidatus Microgenomates bacterium]|nr:MAG: YraN family protein [Candidatus Microgenomates bacterium]